MNIGDGTLIQNNAGSQVTATDKSTQETVEAKDAGTEILGGGIPGEGADPTSNPQESDGTSTE
jgi:hypothetical protein